MIWHFSQRNVAAGSLILWIVLNNVFNSINPLIWPRDDIFDWWDGNVWCDINVRIQIGGTVGLAACTAMIVRKLAKVMDTSNITISSSRKSKAKEALLEIFWCWVYPLIMILVYYVVQPVRYLLFGIVGCISGFDTSWPSMVLSFMWGPITMLVAAFYAGLLVYRLYRYRREFHRLISARNTTKSRFIRLFTICVIIIVFYLPYSLWVLVNLCSAITHPYDWGRVHGPKFNSIVKIPALGQVSIEKWVQVATGYVIFFVFGTGKDSYNLYKKMLVTLGLGKIFPSLYVMRESGVSTPTSFVAAKTWGSNMSAKARNMIFSKTDSQNNSTIDTFNSDPRNHSVELDSISHLRPVTTRDTIFKSTQHNSQQEEPFFLKQIFSNQGAGASILPSFSRRSFSDNTKPNAFASHYISPGVHAHAWATDTESSTQVSEPGGVHVVREVHQDRYKRGNIDKECKPQESWA